MPLSSTLPVFCDRACPANSGKRWYLTGLLAATVVHSLYNLYFILGGCGERPPHRIIAKKEFLA